MMNLSSMLILCCCIQWMLPTALRADELVSPQQYRRQVTLSGFTQAKRRQTISSEVTGRCLEVLVDRGDTVPLSGRIVRIDPTFITLDIRDNALAQQRLERQLDTEQKTLERYTTLHGQKSVPEASLDEVRLSADLHQIRLYALKNEQQRLQERLARHTITATPGWQVLDRLIEAGELVQEGQPVARLGDYRQVIISLALSYTELAVLQAMEGITVFLPDLDHNARASIFRTSPAYDPQTKKITVDLILDQEEPSMVHRGGILAQIQLSIDSAADEYLLPISAIVNRYDAHWIVRANGQRERVLFLGTTEDGRQAIISSPALTLQDRIYRTVPSEFTP